MINPAKKNHTIEIRGKQTSISLEWQFWEQLKRLAQERSLSINALVGEIERRPGRRANLSSELRLFILEQALKQ